MAIEVSVRKEIKSYKEKLFFGLSLRQSICVLVTVVFALSIGLLNLYVLHLKSDDIGLLIMIGSLPILAFGWYQKESLPLETYLKVKMNYRKLRPFYIYELKGKQEAMYEREDKKEDRKRTEYGN